MKPKRFYFRSTALFGTPLHYGVPVFIGFTVLISGLTANAGDILRGGGGSNATNPATAGAAAAGDLTEGGCARHVAGVGRPMLFSVRASEWNGLC